MSNYSATIDPDITGVTDIAMTRQAGDPGENRKNYQGTFELTPCQAADDYTVTVTATHKDGLASGSKEADFTVTPLFINYALVIGLMVVMSCSTAAGVGVIPPSFSVADAERGEEYKHLITVVNGADGDIDCELNAIGPGSEWIAFYRAGDPLTPLETYLFCWDKVPGEDSDRLLQSLKAVLNIGWAEEAEISKSLDNKTIRVFKGGNSAEITLANSGTSGCSGNVSSICQKATLNIRDGKTIDLRVKEEDGELKICKANSGKEQILVKIKVADDAQNEDYNFTIYVKSILPETTAVSGAVAYAVERMSVTAAIQVTGEQILNGTVKSISAANTEIGYPLKITVAFQNDGNVVARPAISGCVIKSGGTNNGTVIDTFVHAETGIKPYKTGTITVLWNTTGHEPGDYNVSVNVSLAGELITATKVLPFTILPRGALTRKGNLSSLYIEGKPQVNRVIKVVAEFENTGMIDTKAKFTGEVYCDGEFIDIVESREKLVTVGETYKLVSYYKILTPGAYLINGSVLYEGKETETIETSFSVAGALDGDLSSLSVEGKLLVGRTIKVIAEFENTGAIDTRASFVGEVYCDDEFMDIVESREKLVTVGETVDLVSYYKITMHGDYLISGMVLYEGRETEAKDVSFTVPEP